MKNRDLILKLIEFNQDYKLVLVNSDNEPLEFNSFINRLGKDELRIVIDKK